jgi:NADH-quinone oxidoreductase subunit N
MFKSLMMISPILWIVVGALLILFLDLFMQHKKRSLLYSWISFVLLGIAWIQLYRAFSGSEGSATTHQELVFSQALVLDNLFRLGSFFVLSALAFLLLMTPRYVEYLKTSVGEYYALLLSASAAMMILMASNDFITLFLALETLSICTYILTGITREHLRSNEASLKYFITGAFSTGFLLYGMTLVYGVTGTIYIDKLQTQLFQNTSFDFLTYTGLIFIVIGFSFKIGVAPFHLWIPDVYEGAPTLVTAFMSVTVKAAGFIVFLRFLAMVVTGSPLAVELLWQILWGLAILTMIVGNLFALSQKSVKRMLAYSSIAHTGYALMGLSVFCCSQDVQVASATLYYLLAYTMMTLGAFTFILYASKGNQEAETFEDYTGLAYRRPWAAAAMSLFLLSLAGFPPTGGFFAKLFLFKTALAQHFYILVSIAIGTTFLSLYYYLKVLVFMYMKKAESEAGEATSPQILPSPFENLWGGMTFTILGTALLTLGLGVAPTVFLQMVLKWSQGFPGL